MPRVYISSTFEDLREHRAVAITTVESLGLQTSAMEKYFASDARPLDLCLTDLQRCDLYIGIFAWRYGFIPAAHHPERLSITECELREAVRLGIPCLIFLSDDVRERWPHGAGDDTASIERLREELRAWKTVARFDSPDKLGLEISKAIFGWRSRPDLTRPMRALVDEFAELPPLPDGTRNLVVEDIMKLVATFPAQGGAANGPRTVELREAVTQERTWVLAGEGGMGKSTALRYLAHHYANEWLVARERDDESSGTALIPVYVRLGSGRTPLVERIRTALEHGEGRCSAEVLDAWIPDKPFLFLFDQLEDSDASASLDDVENLRRRARNARIVVASRPLAQLDRWPWPVARIVPPSNTAMRSFFCMLLGEERGTSLFDLLLQNGVLEPFRRPLFARLLALSSPDLLARTRLTLGKMLRDVLEGRFLQRWERLPESPTETAIARDLLVTMAHDMVSMDAETLPRATVIRHGTALAARRGIPDVRVVETLVRRMLASGLLTEDDRGLRFWHASFRDYFAADWLQQHAGAWTIYRSSWEPRWHDSLVLYFGLIEGPLLAKQISLLLVGFRLTGRLLLINPNRTLSSRLLFVLRCVVQAGDGAGKSREKLIRLLPRDVRYFYLSGARLPVSSPKRSRYYDEDAYRYFSSLVGQLRIPAAFEYLNAASWPLQWVAPGMVHDRDGDSIERLVASVGEPNAHYMVSMLLLASSQPQCFESLQGVIRNGDPGTRSRTLASLTAAASLLRQEDASSLAGLVDRWTPLLTDVALHDDHPDARAQAVQFLRALGHKGSRLTPAARDVFKATLSDPSAEMRKRALSALSPPELKDDLGLAWKLLDDPDLAVAFGALFHFYISADLPRFCRATVNLVRRCFAGEPSLLSVAASLREQLPRETGAPLRCIALLLTAARYSPIRGCQLYSVRALHAMRIAWTIPALIGVLWSDVWEEARGFALHAIADLLGPNAEPHILRALEDPSSEVRWRAVAACRSRDEPFRSQAAPVLFRLREDESESVRNLASAVLREYGRVDEPSLLLPLQLRQP